MMRVDTAVIGSGAGGAAAAATLAEAGVDTMLLEAGPHHDPATFDQREETMIPRLYEEAGQRFTADQSILVMSGRGVGGSTVHNTAMCVATPEPVAERWSRACGVTTQVLPLAEEVLQRIGATLPEDEHVNQGNRLLQRGAEALGLATMRPLTARDACSGCGYCILGCSYNRKRNVLFTHLEPAMAHGLRVRAASPVRRLRRLGPDDIVVEARGGDVRCRRVVVAASALGSPVILENSGLGGRLVGRSLRLHPFAPVAGVYEDPVDAHRGIPQSVIVTGHARFLEGGEGGFVLIAGAAGPGGTGALIPGDAALTRKVMKGYRHLGVAGALLHDSTRGRVKARRDGLPSVRYRPNPRDLRDLRLGIETTARVHFAAGARAVVLPLRRDPWIDGPGDLARSDSWSLRPHDVVLTSVHPQGTVPIGKDPRTGAVDARGALWDAPEVRVADGSLFPTSVGVPPQVTIMALATHVARVLVDERSKRA